MMKHNSKLSPWLWVPSLYFAEGLPYFIVNVISVILYKNMGMSNGDVAFYTGMLYLPWVIKPLWSPFVDIIRTKRWWIISMQIIISLSFIFLALSLPSLETTSLSADAMKNGGVSVDLFKLSLIIFWITAFASSTHDIAADGYYMLALKNYEQSAFVGIRSTFYRLSSIFGQGVLVVIAGILETQLGDIPMAWVLTLLIISVIFSLITLYHAFLLPRAAEDVNRENMNGVEKEIHSTEDTEKVIHKVKYTEKKVRSVKEIIIEFINVFISFFKKKDILVAMLFMLLFRLPESFLVKMLNPFLLDSPEVGGLGLSTQEIGLIYGTVGVIALTIGGILGGFAVSKWGLKKLMWPMALSLALPCSVFLYLSLVPTENLWVIASCVCFDQFGYGFGFTAYMLYLLKFSEGEFKTAHYSICTAFMALSMMLPGMVAGYLQEKLGYINFYWMIMACCLITIFVTSLVKVDENYGKKNV